MLQNKLLRVVQAHLLGFSTGIKFLETLLLVLLVSYVSFHRRLLGPTGLYQISQQSHSYTRERKNTPPGYWPGALAAMLFPRLIPGYFVKPTARQKTHLASAIVTGHYYWALAQTR
jgi:hypothetical protein